MIYEKPFSFSQFLRRTIFLARPNFFNAQDFNKELLIIHNFVEEFNKAFGVSSDIQFNVPSFTETTNVGTQIVTRTMSINWADCSVLYKGVKLAIAAAGVSSYTQTYPVPTTGTTSNPVKPPTYVVLSAALTTVTYADDNVLCGLQADEIPSTAPSVDVEQYKNIQISLVSDPTSVANALCILGTIHPKYKADGTADGFGFLYNCFRNPNIKLQNGLNNAPSTLMSNQSLFEYVVERSLFSFDALLNETQLMRRFNLADIANFDHARINLGYKDVVNYRQLVQKENLKDLLDVPTSRFNLGLKAPASMSFGLTATSVMRGDALQPRMAMLWCGTADTIPTNWALCNGQTKNGYTTPNLSGRFIVGYNPSDTDYQVVGLTGGAKTVALTQANLPNSNIPVTINDPGHHHSANGVITQDDPDFVHNAGSGLNLYQGTVQTSTNTTGITASATLGGSNTAHENRPPYYVVCYIMFVGYEVPTVEYVPPIQATLPYPNYSVPSNLTDDGYSTYIPNPVGGGSAGTVGSGITITNPE